MPRAPRDPSHPTLFGPTEVPAAPIHRPRLRPVQPTAALITSAETDLAQLLNDLIRRSALVQIAAGRLDEGGWNLIEAELQRFFQRGGVATLIVGRLFDLPRGGSLEPNAWRTAASAALERGLRLWSRVTDAARVYYWPRFQGSVALFDAGGSLHALVGSSPFTERSLRRNGGKPTTADQRPSAPDARHPTPDTRHSPPGRCDVTLHLTASDPEWAGGDLDLEERAACVASLYRFYSFFNAEMPRRSPEPMPELTPMEVAQGLSDLGRAVDWITEAYAAPGVDAAAVELQLLRRLAAVRPKQLRADVTFQTAPSGTGLLLDAAARPLIELEQNDARPVLFRMPQPHLDFRAIVRLAAADPTAWLSVTGLPQSRLAALVRRGHLRPGEPVVLAREGKHAVRVIDHKD